MKKTLKRMSAFILTLCLLIAVSAAVTVPFGAAQDDTAESGSLRLLLEPAFEGVGMELLEIGELKNGSFQPNDEFSPSGISFEGVETSNQLLALAETAASYAKENSIEGTAGIVDFDGEINYYDLPKDKVYLLYQTDGFDVVTIQPVVASIPQRTAENDIIYDVTVRPKVTTPEDDFHPAALILTKLNHDNDRLPGAEFSLWRKIYYTDVTKAQKPEYEYGEDEGGLYYWKKSFDRTTDENGQIAVSGMAYGTYRFIEEKAPEGYVLDSEPKVFDLDTHAELKISGGIYVRASGKPMELTVINIPIADGGIKDTSGENSGDILPDDHGGQQGGEVGGEDDESGHSTQLTGDDIVKYIVIGGIVGVSLIVIILLVVIGGRKKKK